jgi:subtilisin family serine protease
LGNNMMGISGVMWYVRMIPLKFIGFHEDPADCGGDTHFCGDVFDEIEAIQYAISKGANVINASYGDYVFSAAERDAIADANAAGILFVAAAGNDGINNDLTPMYPASYNVPNIISVAASDQSDQRAAFSNFGSTSVDVAAPGVYILSTIPAFIAPNGYDFFNGTSMAAPHVSGLGGLLFGYYPHFNQHQVIATILTTTDLVPSMIGSIGSAGRINAYRAISSLQTPESFVAHGVSTTSILVAWADMATGETGYVLERRTGGGAYSQIATPPANSTSHTDTGLADGTTYFYRLKAVNDIPAEGSYAETSGATLISPPVNLDATAPSNTNVFLSWTDTSGSESGFRIERKTMGTDFAEIATVGANITSYNDPTVIGTTRYFYRVRAFNATGVSEYSNEVSIRPRRSSGGGGCSLGSVQNTPTAAGNLAVMLLPIAVIALLRRRR